jgi:hypothetical protein
MSISSNVDHPGHRGIRQFDGHHRHFNRAILQMTHHKVRTISSTREQCMSSATADTINADPLAFIKA